MEELARLMIGGQGSAESLTLRQYRELIFETQRRHSAFVLFYNDREICPSCDGAIGSFEQIAKSFASTYYTYDAHTSTWNLEVPAFFVKVRMTKDYRHVCKKKWLTWFYLILCLLVCVVWITILYNWKSLDVGWFESDWTQYLLFCSIAIPKAQSVWTFTVRAFCFGS